MAAFFLIAAVPFLVAADSRRAKREDLQETTRICVLLHIFHHSCTSLSLSIYIYIMNNRLSPQSNMPGQKLSPDTCLILDLQKLDVRAKQIGYQHAGGSCPKPSLLFFWRLLTSDVNAGVRS